MKFDEDTWSDIIQKPDWYLKVNDYLVAAKKKYKADSKELNQLNKTVRRFFERALKDNKVFLADSGPNLDEQRQPIDTIVIHHTSAKPGYKKPFLNAVHLLNIYVPYFVNPTVKGEESLKGSPLWSGHFYRGKQIFWGYHWLMRMDGRFERLLPDEAIGWQAGNWRINRRSIGICLDNDYEDTDPGNEILQKLAHHIKNNYPQVKPKRIIGHCEAREGTLCPGKNFIHGWKKELLNYLR